MKTFGKTTFVSLRLDAELVRRIDELSQVEKLTRTAVIERLAWREFNAVRLVAPVTMLKTVVASIEPLPGDPMVEWLLSGPPAFEKVAKGTKKGRAS